MRDGVDTVAGMDPIVTVTDVPSPEARALICNSLIGKALLAVLARTQWHHRARRRGCRLPAGDGAGACPRLRVVDPWETLPQLDDGRQLALLMEGGADRGGIRFGHDEHRRSMEHAARDRQARPRARLAATLPGPAVSGGDRIARRPDCPSFATSLESIRPPWPASCGVPLLASAQSLRRPGPAHPWRLPSDFASTLPVFP